MNIKSFDLGHKNYMLRSVQGSELKCDKNGQCV